MALNAYLKLKGQKQGDIKGSATQKGHEGQLIVIAVTHDIVSPRDAASGLPTGRRSHRPLVITKEIDKASPMLMAALVNNENITSFTLDFYQPVVGPVVGSGVEKNYYRIQLTNANVASISQKLLNNKNPELLRYEPYEEVAFTYQKITWTILDGGINASDDWQVTV